MAYPLLEHRHCQCGAHAHFDRRARDNGLVLIVAGHLIVDPADRDAQIQASAGAVRLARQAPGCLDFAVSADPVDPARVNVLERWERTEDLEAFRNSEGDPGAEPVDFSRIRRFEVEQYIVTDLAAAEPADRGGRP